MDSIIITGLALLFVLLILVPLGFVIWLYIHDEKQKEHSVLLNYPILGKFRYITEKIGPELRQYLFNNDREGRPFHRKEFEFVNKAGKYNSRMIGYGAERDFDQNGWFLVNNMFPLMDEELRVEREPKINTHIYQIDKENLFNRKEHRVQAAFDPAYLQEEDCVVLGEHTAVHPFRIKGLIGQSAMSFGSLGDHAITALSRGLGRAGGTWMNTGEGGVSPYHLKGDVDIIMQISPGLFGVRTRDGDFSWEEFENHASTPQIKAFELKMGQGAKTRGGHVDGSKITEEIAQIRKVEPGQDIDSPNRFSGISTPEELLAFLDELRVVGGKPVGLKIVVGNETQVDHLISAMAEKNIIPDFITIDGGEGGTGASYYALAYAVGLPAFAAIPMVEDSLKKYGIRGQTKIIASGKLLTPDKIAIALSLGADLINIARGFMISVGCIMSQVCHKNTCPVGVATTDPHLQEGLVVEEKEYRVTNYLISLRQGLFDIAAVAGLDSPAKLTREHAIYHADFRKAMDRQEQV